MAREFTIIQQVLRSILGNKSDVANASGSVHAKLTEALNRIQSANQLCSPSANIKESSLPQETATSGTPIRIKSIVSKATGVVRVTFSFSSGWSTPYAAVYVNGVARTPFWSGNSTSFTTKTADVSVGRGDMIEIYGYTSDGTQSTQIKDMTVGCDLYIGWW